MAEKGTLALSILVIYNQTMRLFFTLVMFCLMCLCAPLAVAEERKALPKPECTLKNKVFCGEWQDNDGFKITMLGNKLLSSDNIAVEDCAIIDEFVDKKYPYTILKCTYFNPVINKQQTDYELYYMSEKTEKENDRVKGYENIFNVTAQSLRELFLLPEWDKNKDGRPIPTRAGGYLYRETQK